MQMTPLAEKLQEIKILQAKKEVLFDQVTSAAELLAQLKEQVYWADSEITNLTIEILQIEE